MSWIWWPGRTLPGLLAALALPVAPVSAQSTGTTGTARQVSERRALEPHGLLRIWNLTGSVRVVGWDRDSVAITGDVPPQRNFYCAGGNRAMKCAVEVPPGSEEQGPAVNLEARVPRGAQLWIKTSGGGITVSDFAGDLDAYSVSGAITVDGAAHSVTAESMAGAIDVSGTVTTLRARTAAGAITVTAAVQDATASSVSGDVTLTGGRIQRGLIESIDGGIRWNGAIPAGASLDFNTHGGAVQLTLPASTSAEVSINTYEGSLQNDFGPAGLGPSPDLQGKTLDLTLGLGGPTRVGIRTFKGRILLLRR
jgi:Toastrack DUF4097